MHPIARHAAVLSAALFLSVTALAQPAAPAAQVDEPWVRVTVAGQQATGAFFRITAPQASQVTAVSSPVAARAELHTMKMDGDVMRMEQLTALPLPAGQTVRLAPGSLHVMLLGLKAPVKAGDLVPLTLTLQGADGKRSTLELKAVARAAAPGATAPGASAPAMPAMGADHAHQH